MLYHRTPSESIANNYSPAVQNLKIGEVQNFYVSGKSQSSEGTRRKKEKCLNNEQKKIDE